MKNNSKQITVKFETGTAVLENRLRRLKTKLDQVKALIDEINSTPVVINTISTSGKLNSIK